MKDLLNDSLDNAKNHTFYPTTYAVCLLALINVVNYMDRMVISVLLPSIKSDLNLTDGQLGWISGMAFALFYGIFGLPLARVADTWVRTKLVALSLVGWSIMTVVSGAVTNFVTLLIARCGVGVGEAGCIPAGQAMISDMAPKESRAGLLSIFMAGSTIGVLLGMSLGGWLSSVIGWRWTFVIFGAPGILLGLLVWLTLPEPVRGRFDNTKSLQKLPFKDVLVDLMRRRSYMFLVFGFGFLMFTTFAFSQWLPMYYARNFDLNMAKIGVISGLGTGLGMAIGTLIGGFVANKLMSRDLRWGVWLAMGSLLTSWPLLIMLLSVDNYKLVAILQFLQACIIGIATGPVFAVIQALARASERATASAINGLVVSIIGVGGGPLFVGYMSDYLSFNNHPESLKYALIFSSLSAFIAAFLFFISDRYLTKDLKALEN